MSKYLLKITGSNDIVNIVEWNETGSLEAPLGYVFEPFVTGSTDFINYITDTTQSNLPSFYGEMGGYFTGELTGSIKYNGKTFEEFINETQYGSIGIISGSDINILNRPGYVSLISENNVILPISFADSGSSYNRALNRITDENISNYLLKFKLDQNTELQYLINQTVLTSSGELNYYNLDGVLQSTSSLNGNTFEEYFNISNTHGSPWYLDFDLGDNPIVGQIYVDGDKLEDVIKTAPRKYTKFRFNEDPWDSDLVPYGTVGTNPFNNYFVFNEQSSIYGEYGDQSWKLSKPTKIRIDMKPLDASTASDIDFNNKLFKILQGKLVGSIIKFIQDLGQDAGTSAYKEFEIISMFYRESRYENVGGTQQEFFFGMDWGDAGFTENDEYSFYFDRLTSNPKQHYYPTNDRLGFFELEVRQINPATNYIYTQTPEHDDEFFVSVEPKVYSREIYFITSSTSWGIPAWAEQLEFYCVGAGGGGGGGASGYQHDYNGASFDQPMIKNGIRTLNERYTDEGAGFYGIGHDIITGGGGGAGGNIAYKVLYKKNEDFYANERLTLLVGTGGKGGQGGNPVNDVRYSSSPSNTFESGTQWMNYTNVMLLALGIGQTLYLYDNTIINPYSNEFWGFKRRTVIQTPWMMNTKVENLALFNDWFMSPQSDGTPLQQAHFNTYSEFIRNGKYIYDGEFGGKTSVLKNNGDILLEADGGVGGVGGISMRVRLDQSHIVCGNSNRGAIYYYEHQVPQIPVPGGGARKGTSKGDIIRLGGAGAYGITDSVVGNLFELYHPDGDSSRLPYVQPTESLMKHGYNWNCAPNIPWDTGNTNKLNNPRLESFPLEYGWVGELRSDRDVATSMLFFSDSGLEYLMSNKQWNLNQADRYINLSKEIPFKSTDNNKFTLVSPGGGGGGTGKSGKSTWVGTEESPTKAYQKMYEIIDEWSSPSWGNYRKTYLFPPNKFNNVKLQYQEATKIGTGGINTVDTHIRLGAGSQFDIPIGNGGNGGHSDTLFEVGPPTTLPQSGGLYGGGGGGGAGVINVYSPVPSINDESGQNGGDGANGVIVIVVSGLQFV